MADEYLAILPAFRALKTSGELSLWVKNILVFLCVTDMNMTREEMVNWNSYMTTFLMNATSLLTYPLVQLEGFTSQTIGMDDIEKIKDSIKSSVPHDEIEKLYNFQNS